MANRIRLSWWLCRPSPERLAVVLLRNLFTVVKRYIETMKNALRGLDIYSRLIDLHYIEESRLFAVWCRT